MFLVLFQGQPSFARIYQYPNFAGNNAVLANKSFFKADRIHFFWNKIGKFGLITKKSSCRPIDQKLIFSLDVCNQIFQ